MRANREIAFLASSFTHRSSTTNFATNAALFHSVAEINARRSPGALLKSSPIVITLRNPLKHKGSVNMSSTTNGNTIIPSNHTMKHNTNLLQRTLQCLQSSHTQTLLLDGGTGKELFRVGVPDNRKIWSATAIVFILNINIIQRSKKCTKVSLLRGVGQSQQILME